LLGQVETVASLNRFAYANGSPVMFNDPVGLCAEMSTRTSQEARDYWAAQDLEARKALQRLQSDVNNVNFWLYTAIILKGGGGAFLSSAGAFMTGDIRGTYVNAFGGTFGVIGDVMSLYESDNGGHKSVFFSSVANSVTAFSSENPFGKASGLLNLAAIAAEENNAPAVVKKSLKSVASLAGTASALHGVMSGKVSGDADYFKSGVESFQGIFDSATVWLP